MKIHMEDPNHKLDSPVYNHKPSDLIVMLKKDKIILVLKVIAGLTVVGVGYFLLFLKLA